MANLADSASEFEGKYLAIFDVNLGSALGDPGADRIWFWDDSASAQAWLTVGSGLSISTTTLGLDNTVAALLAGTQTFTGDKTFTGIVNLSSATVTYDTQVVTLTGTQTLTNKTLTAPVLGGTITGTYTLGGTPTFPAAVVTLTGTQTLTNKTLTAPVFGGTITGTYTIGGTPTFPANVVLTTGDQSIGGNKTLTGYIVAEGDGESGAGWPLTVGQSNYIADGDIWSQRWFGFNGTPTGTNLYLFQINSDDWLLSNNGYWTGSAWVQPNSSAPSTLIFMASGGQGINFYTQAAGDLVASGFDLLCRMEGTTNTVALTPTDGLSTSEFPSDIHSLYIGSDEGNGTVATRTRHIIIAGHTDLTEKLEIGFDSTGSFATIAALDEGIGGLPLIFNHLGGNVGIGATTSPTQRLQVIGNIHGTGFLDLTEISIPSDPSAGIGRLYAATDGSLHWIDDASNDTDLTAGAAATSLDGLTDVTLTALGDNEILLSASGVFINQTFAEAGLATLTGSETLTNKTLTSPVMTGPSITSGDLTMYEAVNDGNPEIRLGATDAEEFHIQAVYDTGAQTLDYVLFQTDAASATSNKGAYRFNVDGTLIGRIDDFGVNLETGMVYRIGAANVLTAATLGSGVVNSSLTSVGTITTGVWNATDIPLSAGGTGASLTDPNADSILFWDDSAGVVTWLTPGTGLSITTTTISVVAASTTVSGRVELATAAETTTGTDATRAVTPDGLAGSVVFGTRYLQAVVTDFTTAVATGDGQFYMHIPAGLNGMNLVEVHAEVITAGTTGTMSIQIHNATDTADMLSTLLTIDTAETGSDTAATPAVINTATDDVATNDLLRIDIDAIHTTPAQGLIVTLGFRLP